MPIKRIITIMADFPAAYAWARRSMREHGVGGNIADAGCGFPEEYGVPESLQCDFAAWATRFNGCWQNEDSFDWERFHAEGIALSGRLKSALGRRFTILYAKPCEDPKRQRGERTLIE